MQILFLFFAADEFSCKRRKNFTIYNSFNKIRCELFEFLILCLMPEMPTNEALSNWQNIHRFTYEQAAEALGLGRTMFWNYLKRERLPRLVGLACQGVTLGQCVRNINIWHKRHSHTLVTGADALGISRASYFKYLHMRPELVPRTVMLACAALDEGCEPIGSEAGGRS